MFTDIADVNRIWVENYTIASIESFDEESLVITGDQGYPDYLRIDVKFIAPQYLACATHFDGEVLWRIASEEEAKLVRQTYKDNSHINVYCVEENFSAFLPPHPNRKPRKFFIAAVRVEITVFYGGKNIDELLRPK